jgi:hypothetical protein
MCLIKHRAIKTRGGAEVYLHAFLVKVNCQFYVSAPLLWEKESPAYAKLLYPSQSRLWDSEINSDVIMRSLCVH